MSERPPFQKREIDPTKQYELLALVLRTETSEKRAEKGGDILSPQEFGSQMIRDSQSGELRKPRYENIYPDEEIEKDMAKVADMESKFAATAEPGEKEAHDMGRVLEAILIEQIELAEWFGPSAYTIRASKYDDYTRGIDFVIEFEPEDENSPYTRIGVDATTSFDYSKKLKRVKDQIEQGFLPKVKYFASEQSEQVGKTTMPSVIISIPARSLIDVGQIWLRQYSKDEAIRKTAKARLASHPLQMLALKEAETQLQLYADYAAQYAPAESKDMILRNYNAALKEISRVLKEKERDEEAWKNIEGFDYKKMPVLQQIPYEWNKIIMNEQHTLTK